MKKLLACLFIVLVAFSAFAAINVAIDTIMQYAGKDDPQEEINDGFTIGGADETVFADMNATLNSNIVTALLNLRFRMPSEKYLGAAVEVHSWEIKAKLTDGLKMSIGNTAYEIYAETISWEPVFGAGLFEQGKNRIYFEYVPDFLSDLKVIAGMSMGKDRAKPWKTFQFAAIYEIPMTMYISAEFSLVPSQLCLEMYNDGEVKTFSFQLDYIGTENLNLLGGYTLIMAEGTIVQHRFDVYGSYLTDNFLVELYDALLLRLYEGEGMGNRLGAKFTWYASEKLSPFVKFNWFKNYGYAATVGGFAWADCQLVGPGTDKSLMVLEPGVGFAISDNLSGSLGATLKFNLSQDAENKTFWSIPLCLTATF